ncbi:iron-containing alcohol dehydrogenase, partial [Paenibacillus phytohabitans]|uniref:iron-containing alcohol dehydrogenase n=1 Tax=Paenibacillus phytohabitans TaxID=2654978 RepID=UPI0030083411
MDALIKSVNYHDFRMPELFRFGVNTSYTLNNEIRKMNAQKVAIISDKGLEKVGLVDKIFDQIKELPIQIVTFTNIVGEPTFEIVKEAVTFVNDEDCDLIIGIGGGSSLDVAKAAAALSKHEVIERYLCGTQTVVSRLTHCILLPTTSGTGSEVTMNAIFGDTQNELKRGIVSPAFLPDVAIIDPVLSQSCPPRVTAASGVDAFTHAIESYIAVKATPLTKIYAEKAMKLFQANITKA